MDAVIVAPNSLAWERCIAEACAVPGELRDAIDGIRYDKLSPPPSFRPFVVWELGLGPLSPYIPNLADLLAEGVRWQRIRGTVAAVDMALAWIGYQADFEEAWHGRVWWNSYQLRFRNLPAADYPDLERVEAISEMSTPLRSRFRRGVHLYDAGALIADFSRLDDSILERESGVSITPAGTLWSFGRVHEIAHTLTEAEGLALGNWIEPTSETSLRWSDMTYPWSAATFPWSSQASAQRRSLMAGWFAGKTMHVCLRDSSGAVIGYRKCRASRSVRLKMGGPYKFAADSYEPITGGEMLYIEALTDFGDRFGVNASSASLIVDAERASGIKPGKLWLEPNELIGGTEIAVSAVAFPMRETVREQLKFLVRF